MWPVQVINFTIPPSNFPQIRPSSRRTTETATATPADTTSTGVSERGGRSGSTPLAVHTAPDNDLYELADYRDIELRREAEAKEARRAAKRVEKRRWLEDQDEMKFSHSIQFNAVPDWSSHYIAYSNLKKL